MELRSLGYQTDLIFAAFDGQIIDRGHYLVIKTPSNPTFFWGNFLLFEQQAQVGDELRWRALFQDEVGTPPRVPHQAFGWDTLDGETGAIQSFLDAGFRLRHLFILTVGRLSPPANIATQVTVRPLKSDMDWSQALENQVRCRDLELEESGYRTFKQTQMDRYRAMVSQGLGAWFGAFIGPDLVADAGVFQTHGLGRYQSVGTHPDHRRKGIAGTLIFEAGLYAQAHFGVRTLVIAAHFNSAASRLYRSLGFTVTEHQVGLELWKNEK